MGDSQYDEWSYVPDSLDEDEEYNPPHEFPFDLNKSPQKNEATEVVGSYVNDAPDDIDLDGLVYWAEKHEESMEAMRMEVDQQRADDLAMEEDQKAILEELEAKEWELYLLCKEREMDPNPSGPPPKVTIKFLIKWWCPDLLHLCDDM